MDRFSHSLKQLAPTALVAVLVAFIAFGAVANDKMDTETHTLLIQKLEHVLSQSSARDVATIEVRLRLADLLAERARLYILQAEGKDSKLARDDRKEALAHYQMAVNRVDSVRRANALMQMGHLHEALGEPQKAIALYTRIAKEGTRVYPREMVGLALSSWGDILFRKAQYKEALVKFNAAEALSSKDRKGYVVYRIAWCNLNLGKTDIATRRLVEILRTPELLVRRSGDPNNSEIDTSFHEDVARDLVSFIARGSVNPGAVALLLELSPENIRRENLRSLAKETERLGKKREAIYVWALILEDEPNKLELIEGRVHLATLEWGLNRKAEAAEQIELALATWKKEGCKEKDECAALKAKIRKLIVDWNRLEKDRVTTQLVRAYAAYNNHFTDEADMHFWAAQVSRLLKRYNEASALYRRSSILAYEDLKMKENAELRKMFEAALVAQIEMAESGGDLNVKEMAYDHYLNLNPKGQRALEVRYQRARVYYDKNLHEKAAGEFRAVALTKTKDEADMRKKAADLALDALVLAKQEKSIEPWALEFAATFPKARTEYIGIARRAVLKEVALISNNEKSSDSDLKYATRRLREINLEGASKEERQLVNKNYLVLAVRTRDLDETSRAADRILSTKGSPEKDRELALEKKVWVSEMRLNFNQAYRLSQQMEMSKLSDDDRQMRLAYLAELAGRNAKPHYEAILANSRARSKQELAALRLIRTSRNPWRELSRQEPVLRRNREVFAGVVLELYARTHDTRKAQAYVKDRQIARTAAGQTISRSLSFRELNTFDRQIASHRILAASDRLLNTTLTQRLKLLKQADERAGQAIRAKDWTLQAITLTIVARENQRAYEQILALPVPRKLKGAQQKQYQQALAQRATPFKVKADEVNRKLNDFWNNDREIDAIAKALDNSVGDVTKVLAEEARELAKRAPASVRSRLENAVAQAFNRPSGSDIVSARKALASDPFSARQAERLRQMEAQTGGDAMVTYLDARLNQLKGGAQ